ncbi:MAG: UDP-N-acetylmuramoyl-L-alanine--D-glutamate ligase [Bacteroidetes bacterium]|nr:UDP-N-acetylmuramoyl-L-alanine--D-glutamate ligase [Bacteroidota bacterium]MDA0898188.1 UDP-N-acetylmuramoyl-L-alanine--D-glutamate ligase [Bacteroidota bacterium]
MNHPYSNIAILGAGISGMGAAQLAHVLGIPAFLSDAKALSEKDKERLNQWGIDYEEHGHDVDRLKAAAAIIKSPGIPHTAAIIKALKAGGAVVLGEVDWAANYTAAKLIGITGSNGKTTTATLCHHIIAAEKDAVLAGNVGQSLAGTLADRMQQGQPDPEVVVLELSSFQLDDVYRLKLDQGILTNITPDHLDRYDYDLKKYAASKMQLATYTSGQFIYCDDDPITKSALEQWLQAHPNPPTLLAYGTDAPAGPHRITTKENNTITIQLNNEVMTIEELALQGKHNMYNSMAAGLSSRLMNIRKETIRKQLSTFDSLEHRLESVLNISGVEYINDSKATNVNATYYALECQSKPVVWIVGGVDKGNDYAELLQLVQGKVKGIVALGLDNEKIKAAFGTVPAFAEADTMKDAVRAASKMADKGDVVLLSPSCASFDLFENYEDRGHQFKNAVRML